MDPVEISDQAAMGEFEKIDGDMSIDMSPDRPTQVPVSAPPTQTRATQSTQAPTVQTGKVEDYFESVLSGKARPRNPDGTFTAQQAPLQARLPDQVAQQQPAQGAPGQFNFAEFPPNEAQLFQQMSHQAREYFGKLSRQVRNGEYLPVAEVTKRLEAAKAESARGRWFDHESGYALNNEYLGGIKSLDALDKQENAYQTALTNILSNKPFRLPVQDSNGNIMLAAESWAPDAAGQSHVVAKLSALASQRANIQSQLSNIEANHKNAYGSHINAVTQFHNEMFSEHEKSPAFKQATDQAVNELPGWLKHMPEARSFAAGRVLVNALMAMLKDLQAQNGVRQAQQAAPGQATVPIGQLPPGGAPAKPGDVDDQYAMQEFARMKMF